MAKKQKREEFVIKIGSNMRNLIDKQKKIIRDVTYNCVEPSDYEVCEILAKKIKL